MAFAFLSTLVLESLGNVFGLFWYYPYYTPLVYFSIIILEYYAYVLLILEGYWAAKEVLSKNLPQGGENSANTVRLFSPSWHKLLKFSWILLSVASVMIVSRGGFPANWITVIYSPHPRQIPFVFFALFGFSLWGLVEYLSTPNGGSTILISAFAGNWIPLIAALLASGSTSLVFEYYNTYFGVWAYDNIPFAEIDLFGVPLIVYLFWPLQYFVLVPAYSIWDAHIASREPSP